MPRFHCLDCGKLISTEAEDCPKCGRVISDEDVEESRAGRRYGRNVLLLLLSLLVTGLLVAGVLDAIHRRRAAGPQMKVAVESDVRDYYKGQQIAATVLQHEDWLLVSFRDAPIDSAADKFFKEQGAGWVRRASAAGIRRVIIEANNSSGKRERREFPLSSPSR